MRASLPPGSRRTDAPAPRVAREWAEPWWKRPVRARDARRLARVWL